MVLFVQKRGSNNRVKVIFNIMLNLYNEEKIRVLHVVTSLDTGGMENGVVNLCNGHRRDKYQLAICCLKRPGILAKRLKDDVQLINLQLPEGKPFLSPLKIAKIIKKISPHVVHTHGLAGGSYVGIVGSLFARVPVTVNGEHGAFYLKPHQILIQKILALLCDCTLSVSYGLRRKIIQNIGLANSNIKVIPNGVDTTKFSGKIPNDQIEVLCRTVIGFNSLKDAFVIGLIGSLKPEKNQMLLLRSINELRNNQNKRNIIAFIIGDGDDKDKLMKYVADNGLSESVFFLGRRDDIPNLLKISDVLVSTSLSNHEGMSNVILEAMASGLPIISTKSVGSKELIENNSFGFLIELANVNDLSNRILFLYNNPEKAKKMGEQARHIATKYYSLEKMVESYEKTYYGLLKVNSR